MYILKIHRLTCVSLLQSVSISDEESITKCVPQNSSYWIFFYINLAFRDHTPKTPFFSACSSTTEISNIWLHLSSLPKQPGLISGLILSCSIIKALETTCSLVTWNLSTGRSSRVEEHLWAYCDLEDVIHLNFQDFRFSSYDMNAVRWKREWAWNLKQMQTWGLIMKQFTFWCRAYFYKIPTEASGISMIVNSTY